MFHGAGFQRRQHGVDVGEQQVGRLRQLHRQAGIEHVRTGHALVHEARVRPDRLGQPGQERNHVVTGLALDRVDPLDLRGVDAGELRAALLADVARCFFRNGTNAGHALGGERLDLEPDAVAVFSNT